MDQRGRFLLISGLILSIAFFSCSSTHKFPSYSNSPDNEVMLRGTLSNPSGDGPFPAVVILHGCGGITDNHRTWAYRLKSWGYVAMVLDSHGPRGIRNNCGRIKQVSASVRATDAYRAKNYLAELPFVDRNNIGVIGFSHGGSTTLASVVYQFPDIEDKISPFKAAVAFYPYCNAALEVNTNLMILTGENDDWTPSAKCVLNTPFSKDDQYEVTLKVYPDTYHSFDFQRRDRVYFGHVLKYNREAASDAISQVKAFFGRHLKKQQ